MVVAASWFVAWFDCAQLLMTECPWLQFHVGLCDACSEWEQTRGIRR